VLTKSLAGYLPNQGGPNAPKASQRPNKAASRMLKQLAFSAGKQSAGQQQRAAQSLLKAANKIPDVQVKADLRQAASALGHGDTKRAQQALKNAASHFSASQNAQHTKSSVSTARRQLDRVKNDISGLKRSSGTSRNKTGGKPVSSAQSQLHGGKEAAGARGAPPSGLNGKQARGKKFDSRAGSTESSRNVGGGADRAGKAAGSHYAVVYVPGQIGRGHHYLPIVLHGSPKRVPLVPYQQVIAKYGKSARTAISRSALPPSLQTYVRKYFTVLAH
jgi:hypothetical protein